ncbi:hypothetical protein ACOCG7_04165 [Paraburkholderia sp. DD10]|jgi:hypothetical protein|uniref:hypothetical protein n=1 Tax=Paraburkholderia TaxID=1822464 RepID=UPI0009F273A1|nr:hypothetical protein [Paraburkholderia terricola]MDR6495889.1 hypothetical protein [Paraburkholderia terricola]ORC45440.1 hypothetical protein B2G74_30525 [Burkholderia sp. A27]
MSFQIFASYRGYSINVQVTPARTLSFHGVGRRYKVSWFIKKSGHPGEEIAGFPERLEFMSEHEAFRYAENRAHTFIDCVLSRRHAARPAVEGGASQERSLGPGG